MKKGLISSAVLSAVGVLTYVSIIAWIMRTIGKAFGTVPDTVLSPVLLLMLFVTSAAITGLLVLGKPAYLFFSGNKKDAITLLLITIGLIALLTFIVFLFVATTATLYLSQGMMH